MNRLAPAPSAVVYDINVLVTAAASGNSPFRSWPSPPPVSGNPSADCLAIVVDVAEFALWLSPHITSNVDRTLDDLFKWDQPEVDTYLETVASAAEHSGGGVLADVPRTVRECPDHEDNLILDLAAEVGALNSKKDQAAPLRGARLPRLSLSSLQAPCLGRPPGVADSSAMDSPA